MLIISFQKTHYLVPFSKLDLQACVKKGKTNLLWTFQICYPNNGSMDKGSNIVAVP